VFGARQPIDERALTGAIEIGEQRTFEQDPKYAIRLLLDIASRRPALLHWEERLQTTIERSFEDVEEKQEASVEDRQGQGVPRRQAAKV
jgi:hypothetical protein